MSHNVTIPFLDLITPHRELRDELNQVFEKAQDTAGFIGGPMVDAFEREFAAYCGTAYCTGVGSGTDALRFAFMASGVGEGDAVITVAHTFIATTEAISQVRALPLFVDIHETTYNMDPASLRQFIETQCEFGGTDARLTHRATGRRVAAVVPVHIYGQMADMDPILALAEQYNLVVIEDACQAHGAEYFSKRENRWCKAGSMGKAAAFSFYPGKNLGACGEAGAVTSDDADLTKRIRMIRDHGQATKYYHDIEGYNGRLDSIQAGILSVKLRQLQRWTTQRQQAAKLYRELLAEAGDSLLLPQEPDWSKAVYHLFVIRVADRAQLQKHLAEANIGTGIHYPIPLHLQKAYKHLGYSEGDLPVTEKAASEILSLPMFPGLTPEQQECVVQRVLEFASLAQV